MGNSELSFAEVLRWRYGVGSIEESCELLCSLVEQAPDEDLIILAHNGPTGLGTTAFDLWGRDFGGEQGDWGDHDLRVAIDHAQLSGKRVLAVEAGHMHRTPQHTRTGSLIDSGVLYVNPARVPRVFDDGRATRRHHMELTLSGADVQVRDRCVSAD
jgi:uncharacterized protein (TIGR04168 family)